MYVVQNTTYIQDVYNWYVNIQMYENMWMSIFASGMSANIDIHIS